MTEPTQTLTTWLRQTLNDYLPLEEEFDIGYFAAFLEVYRVLAPVGDDMFIQQCDAHLDAASHNAGIEIGTRPSTYDLPSGPAN